MRLTSENKDYVSTIKNNLHMKHATKAPEFSITTRANLSKTLIDKRLGHAGIVFGTLGDVARQYGIKISDTGSYRVFSGPKNRLQMFAEKLHFACIKFF